METRINNHERLSTCIVVLVLQLQVFRRLSMAGYMVILLLAYLYWFSSIGITKRFKTNVVGFLFLISYLGLPIISIFNTDISDYFTALMRYCALMPFYFIAFTHSRLIYKYRVDLMRIYCIVVFFASVLTFYQILFGRISFFVDIENGRIGYERYGSLLGSVTTYGTASLSAIFCLHSFKLFTKKWSVLLEVVIVLGGIVCLSKAFYINAMIAYFLIFLFNGKKNRSIGDVVKAIGIIGVGIVAVWIAINYTFIGDYFHGMMDYTFASNRYGTESALADRLYKLPSEAFEYHNMPFFYYLLCGVGFKGYGGVLGIRFPQCHNNYADILLAQGLLGLVSLVLVYLSSFTKLLREKTEEASFIKQIVIYALINMMAGQWMYLAVTTSLFLCIIFSIYSNHRCDQTLIADSPLEVSLIED